MIKPLQTTSPTTLKTVSTAPPVHYVMWRISRGGAEMSVLHYIDRFAEERSLHAYSLKKIKDNIFKNETIQIIENQGTKWQRMIEYYRYCHKNRHHIFHLLNVGPLILLITLLAGIRKPIYHIHGTKYWKKGLDFVYLKPAWLFCSLYNVTFIANSNYSASIFQNQVLPNRNPQVIYNGMPWRKFLEKRYLRSAPHHIAYAGRLHPGKNVEAVIALFEVIAEDFPHTHLHIAGDGVLRADLEAQAQQSPYRDRIHFQGFVQDMASFYAAMDVFVFLSAHESFGNVLVEALLTGLPVLTSNVPVFKEIFGKESAFILGDPKDFATIKQRFITALAHYPQLAAQAWALGDELKDQFSVEQHTQKIKTIYDKH